MTQPGSAARDDGTVFPMTFEQEAVWLADHLDDEPSRYLESWAYRLSGPVDLDAVQWAIDRMVDRHEALRTVLTVRDERLVQVVRPDHHTRLDRRRSASLTSAELRALVAEPLDLETAPLRASVLELAADECVLVLQLHHAVVDDWGLAVIDREFSELYTARVSGRPERLPPLPQRLGDYAAAQRAAGVDASVLGYWRRQLSDVPTCNSPPADYPRPARPSHKGDQVRFRIDAATAQLIRAMCRRQRTTPFTILAAAVAVLIGTSAGTTDVIVGTPVSRRTADVDQLIACLTGILPLRVRIADTFADLVTATRAALWAAIAHQGIPYATLVSQAVDRKKLRTLPLCQTVLVVDDEVHEPLTLPGLTAERIYVPTGAAKFDLCVTLVLDHDGYQGFLDYSCDLFARQTAQRIAADYLCVLARGLCAPHESLITPDHGRTP